MALSVDEFAGKVKAKYPEYKDVDNRTLSEKIVAKYPEYKDKVDLSAPTQPTAIRDRAPLPDMPPADIPPTSTDSFTVGTRTAPAQQPITEQSQVTPPAPPAPIQMQDVMESDAVRVPLHYVGESFESAPVQFLLNGVLSDERADDLASFIGEKFPNSPVAQNIGAGVATAGNIISPLDLLTFGTAKGMSMYKQSMEALDDVGRFAVNKTGGVDKLRTGFKAERQASTLANEQALKLQQEAQAVLPEELTNISKIVDNAKEAGVSPESIMTTAEKKLYNAKEGKRYKYRGMIESKQTNPALRIESMLTEAEKMEAGKAYNPMAYKPKPIKTFDDYLDNMINEEAPSVIKELGIANDPKAINNLKKAGVKVNPDAVEKVPEMPSMVGVVGEHNKTVYKDLLNHTILSGMKGLKRQGIWGNWIANKLHYVRDITGIRTGTSVSEMTKVAGNFSKSELDQLLNAQDLGAEITSPKVQRAFDVIDQMKREVAREIKALGGTLKRTVQKTIKGPTGRPIIEDVEIEVPWEEMKNYYPHSHDFAELLSSSDARERAVAHLVKTKQFANKEKARLGLTKYIRKNMHRRAGNLEYSRMIDLPGYEKNPLLAWEKYFKSAYGRIEELKAFGKGDAKLKYAIQRIEKAGGNSAYADEVASRQLRITTDEVTGRQWMGAAKNLATVTKMHLSALTNMQQQAQIVGVSDIAQYKRGLQAAFSEEGVEFATRAGTILDSAIEEVTRRGVGASLSGGTYLKKVGFTKVERANRLVATLTGREMVKDFFRLAKKNPSNKYYRRELLKLGFNPDKLLKKAALSENDLLMAGRSLSERTQFLVDAIDLPQITQSPWGKFMLQLKTFAIKQTEFMYDEVLKEAIVHKNPKPLIKVTLAMAAIGEPVQDIKALIKMKDREYELTDWRRWAKNAMGGGAFGILQDIHYKITGTNPVLDSLVAPVALASAGQLLGGVYNISVGNFKRGAKQIAPNIPFIGPTLSGALRDKPKNRKKLTSSDYMKRR